MKTVGDMLRAARLEKNISLEELSGRTKIQERFLTALEESRIQDLPAAPFVKGYIRIVSEELGLPPQTMVAVFRRDFNEDRKGHVVPRSLGVTEKSWRWTPALTIILGVTIVVVSFLSYLGIQLVAFVRPPRLELAAPKEHEVVSVSVLVEGKTDPGATMSINGQDIKNRRDGTFSEEITLDEGKQTIVVMATGQNKKTTTIERTVTVKRSESGTERGH